MANRNVTVQVNLLANSNIGRTAQSFGASIQTNRAQQQQFLQFFQAQQRYALAVQSNLRGAGGGSQMGIESARYMATAAMNNAKIEQTLIERKMIGSREQMSALRSEVALRRELARNDKMNAWQTNIAQNGRLGASLGLIAEKLKGVEEWSAKAGRAALYGSVGMAGFIAAASPSAIMSLGTQFQILGARIGRDLIPFAARAITLVHDLSDWYGSLNPMVRESAANILGWSAAAAAAAWGVSRLVRVGASLIATLAAIGRFAGVSRAGAMNMGLLASTGAPVAAGAAGGRLAAAGSFAARAIPVAAVTAIAAEVTWPLAQQFGAARQADQFRVAEAQRLRATVAAQTPSDIARAAMEAAMAQGASRANVEEAGRAALMNAMIRQQQGLPLVNTAALAGQGGGEDTEANRRRARSRGLSLIDVNFQSQQFEIGQLHDVVQQAAVRTIPQQQLFEEQNAAMQALIRALSDNTATTSQLNSAISTYNAATGGGGLAP